MLGINGMEDFYATSAVTENLHSFFTTLRDFQVLNLHSCILNRGHGLECILKSIPNFSRLEALRLEGWQMDRITVEALVDSLRLQYTKSIKYLSLRSNLFIGEDSFAVATECLQHIPHLETLNISYCSLGDDAVVLLIERLQLHPKMTRVHLGGNFCHSQRSVDAISNWIQHPSCNLQDLNLRSLWVGFTEEGLVQRFVDLVPLFQALSENGSICNLSLSENYLEDKEVLQLSKALLSRQKQDLRCLDVGDNPFEQKGAECLIDLVSNTRSLHHIRFENHYMQFQSGEFIKLLVEFNYYDKVLVDKSAHIPLSLWPKALAKVQEQQNQEENALGESRVPNHLFRLLRSSTGPFGHELSLQIALHSSKSPI
jgi:Ran GTPase-activating protein (RanGAP) involved in mRNA processing and transport